MTVKRRPSLEVGERGTIKPKANFDAKEDAVALRKALEGLGTLQLYGVRLQALHVWRAKWKYLYREKKNCQKNLVATAHHLATWVFHYDCVKWFCHFVFFFILTDCSPAEMPAGIFFIVSTFVSLHVPSAFRHHREGFN